MRTRDKSDRERRRAGGWEDAYIAWARAGGRLCAPVWGCAPLSWVRMCLGRGGGGREVGGRRGPPGLWEGGPGDGVGPLGWGRPVPALGKRRRVPLLTLVSRSSQVLQRIQREAPTKEARGARTQGRRQEEEREWSVRTRRAYFLVARGGGIAPGGGRPWPGGASPVPVAAHSLRSHERKVFSRSSLLTRALGAQRSSQRSGRRPRPAPGSPVP